jgi:hypothetical protein
MSHPELLILGVLRALVEVALLFLVGQGLLAVLAADAVIPTPFTSCSC